MRLVLVLWWLAIGRRQRHCHRHALLLSHGWRLPLILWLVLLLLLLLLLLVVVVLVLVLMLLRVPIVGETIIGCERCVHSDTTLTHIRAIHVVVLVWVLVLLCPSVRG
jgi:hypothetical protein